MCLIAHTALKKAFLCSVNIGAAHISEGICDILAPLDDQCSCMGDFCDVTMVFCRMSSRIFCPHRWHSLLILMVLVLTCEVFS